MPPCLAYLWILTYVTYMYLVNQLLNENYHYVIKSKQTEMLVQSGYPINLPVNVLEMQSLSLFKGLRLQSRTRWQMMMEIPVVTG